MTNDTTYYNEKAYFEKTVAPLLKNVIDKCASHNIPVFFTAAVANDDKETVYINDGFMTGSSNIHLADDKIKYHMMIAGGCVAVPKRETTVIDMSQMFDYLEDEDDDAALFEG